MERLASHLATVRAFLLFVAIGLVYSLSISMAEPADSLKQITDVAKGVRAVSPVFIKSGKGAYLIWTTSMTNDEMLRVYHRVHPALTWPKLSFAPIDGDMGKALGNASFDGYFNRGRGDISAAMLDDYHGIIVATTDARSGLYPNNSSIITFRITNEKIKLDTSNPTIISNATESAVATHKGVAYIVSVKKHPSASSENTSTMALLKSNDDGKNWTQKEFADIDGRSPCIFSDGIKLFISFISTDKSRRKFIKIISTSDGVIWSKPMLLFDANDIVKYSMLKREESIVCVYSKKESQTNWVPGYADTTAAFNANIITGIQLSASNDNGITWSLPIKLTDGKNADHYPMITIIDNKLYLSFSRITTQENTFESLSANILFEGLGDWNDMLKKIAKCGKRSGTGAPVAR